MSVHFLSPQTVQMGSKCVMLIKDNDMGDFANKKKIHGIDEDDITIRMRSAVEALAYIMAETEPKPDMIFLDLCMPVMEGREFLNGYFQLEETVRSRTMIVMLPTAGVPLL